MDLRMKVLALFGSLCWLNRSKHYKVEEIHAHPVSREKRYNSVEIEIAIGTWHIWKM